MATSIKPLGQRVLAKRIDEDETSAGGIIIPDSAREKPQEAEIVALGTGGKNEDGSDFEVHRQSRRQSSHLQIRRH